MIGRLRGNILEKQPPMLLVEAAGIGYEVQASMTTFYRLPEVGQEIILYTHLVVREDAHLLFGFADQRERALFRTLIKVNGVGPKLALTILSSIDADDFVRCVQLQDSASLTRLPGIGKKTAERLIIEMRDRLTSWDGVPQEIVAMINPGTASNSRSAIQDAVSALVTLGYRPQEASRAVALVENQELSREELIRLALKGLAA